jgi:hypothetical protein
MRLYFEKGKRDENGGYEIQSKTNHLDLFFFQLQKVNKHCVWGFYKRSIKLQKGDLNVLPKSKKLSVNFFLNLIWYKILFKDFWQTAKVFSLLCFFNVFLFPLHPAYSINFNLFCWCCSGCWLWILSSKRYTFAFEKEKPSSSSIFAQFFTKM